MPLCLLVFQEIICQKNTVSTQSNLFFPLAFAFHTLLTHCSHIMCCKENAFLQRAGCTVSNTLCFSPRCYKGLCCRSCDECSVSQKCEMKASFLPLSRRFFSSDDSCFTSQSDCRATICIKRHKQFEKFDLQKVQHSNKVLP